MMSASSEDAGTGALTVVARLENDLSASCFALRHPRKRKRGLEEDVSAFLAVRANINLRRGGRWT